MTSAILTSPPSVLDALRGDRAARPPLDTAAAARRRAELELGVAEVLGETTPDLPFVITATALGPGAGAVDLLASARGRLRGALVSVLLRLHVVGTAVTSPFDDALAAWCAEGPSPELLARCEALDAEERARLATDVTAHYVTLTRAIGEVPPGWNARTAQRASLRLGGGRVLLRDTVDLVIGSTRTGVASVVLLDVTTAPLGEGAERALRFHALVETLRSSAVPLRSAVLSSATGELWLREVDDELLARAVLDVLAALHEQRRGR
ncbi:MAG: hypothetical protein ACHQFZ_05000 [Acidimicrobiales bacterium]